LSFDIIPEVKAGSNWWGMRCKVPSGPVVIGKDGVSFDPAQSAKPQISPLRYASVEMTNLGKTESFHNTELPTGPHVNGPHSQMYEAWFGMIEPPSDYSVYDMSWVGPAASLIIERGYICSNCAQE